jgi:hypothetical protein
MSDSIPLAVSTTPGTLATVGVSEAAVAVVDADI